MRTLFVLAAIAALAHGAPHRDSHHELEPQTDAHAKRVPKPTLAKHSATPAHLERRLVKYAKPAADRYRPIRQRLHELAVELDNLKADGEKMQSAARTASSAVQGAYGFYTTWAPWAVGAAGATMDAIASSTVGQTVIGTLGWAGQQLAPAVTQERLAMVATGLRGLRLCVVLAMAAANLEMIQQLLISDGAATPAYRVIAATGVTPDGWFTVANLWGIMEYMGAADVALSVLQLVVRALRGSNQPVPFSGRELATFIVEPNAALLDGGVALNGGLIGEYYTEGPFIGFLMERVTGDASADVLTAAMNGAMGSVGVVTATLNTFITVRDRIAEFNDQNLERATALAQGAVTTMPLDGPIKDIGMTIPQAKFVASTTLTQLALKFPGAMIDAAGSDVDNPADPSLNELQGRVITGFTTDYDAMEAELAKKAGKTLTPAGADIPYFMQLGELAAITVYSYA